MKAMVTTAMKTGNLMVQLTDDHMLKPGKAGTTVLDRSVKRLIRGVSGMDDALFINADPVTMRTSYPGKLAVHAVCNGMYAKGYAPRQCTLTVLLPEGSTEEELRRIIDQAARTAEEENIKICGGHTEVTGAVTRPVVCASAAGVPMRKTDAEKSREITGAAAGDGLSLIMTGYAGIEGSFLMASECTGRLQEHFSAELTEQAALMFSGMMSVRAAAEALAGLLTGVPLHTVSLSEGGVYAGLWKICEELSCGMRVYFDRIPILQETVEMSNALAVDPYGMQSAGSLLIAAADPGPVLECLDKAGVPAVCIGELVPGNDRILINDDEERFLDRPKTDTLYPVLGF